MIVETEATSAIQESARYRELERLLAFSASRDGLPVAWRRAVRFMFLMLAVEKWRNGGPGAYLLLRAALHPRRVGAPNR